jgi:hypothetical protein
MPYWLWNLWARKNLKILDPGQTHLETWDIIHKNKILNMEYNFFSQNLIELYRIQAKVSMQV